MGGLLSFASPCVLPLVPAYVGYLGGSAATGAVAGRRAGLLNSLAFVLGFSLVFVTLGASIGLLSQWLIQYRTWAQRIGGAVVIVLGLHTAGLIRIPALYSDKRVNVVPRAGIGYLSSFLLGVFFSAGWMPCVGPILAGILLLAGNAQTAGRGAGLLLVYSLGLGLPFIVTGLLIGSLRPWLQRANRHLHLVSVLSGVLLMVLGLAIMFDQLKYLSSLGAFLEVGP